MKQVSSDSAGIALAIESIKNGGVVIFPTDTVYGIGCNPYNEDAVEIIYELKNRDCTKPLPILGYSKRFLENLLHGIHLYFQNLFFIRFQLLSKLLD